MAGYAWADSQPPFATQWGSYGLQQTGKFAYPQGVSVGESGNVYVTDLGNRRVQEFDNNGNFLTTWGIKGSGNGTFQEPAGIAVRGGYVYVVDNELNLVQKFDTHGNFIMQWGSRGSGNGQFLMPQGVAVDSKGNVYVVDTGNSRVEKFTGNGTYLLSIGSSGLGEGQFLSPHGVAVDSLDFVYVTDTGNNRVEKFGQDGTYLQSYGEDAGLKSPIGVSVDSSGNIYVADDGNNRIVEFESNGNMASWGSSGTGPNFFMEPRDVAVDSSGNVFVVDSDNNRIQKFGSDVQPASQTAQQQASQTTVSQNPTTQTQAATPAGQNQSTAQVSNSSLITDPSETTLPQITAPPDMTVEATAPLTPVQIGQATATDAVKVVSITNNAPTKFPLGVTMVTWTAMNAGGNVAKAVQKVTVIDTTPPTLTAPPNITVQATSADHNVVTLGTPSSYDAVGVESVTNDAPAYFPLGQTVVTWKAVDASGNTATANQTVAVVDSTPPTIKAPADMTVNATGQLTQVNIGQATANDDTGISSLTNDAPQQGFPIGTTVVTWTAADDAGNTANATQKITVENRTPPKLTPPPAVTFEATSLDNNTVPLGNATAKDFESVGITNNAPKVFPLGKTLVTWTATDISGNTANATQVVDVVHTIPPKITPPKDVTFEATSLDNNTMPLGNATAKDFESVGITNNASKAFPLGKTVVLWTAKDTSGNTANATQVVDVVHTIPPKLAAPPAVTFEATSLDNNTVPLGTPAVSDIEQVTVTNNAPKSFPIGMTTVTWTAKDTSGNTANATQVVDVIHTIPPKLAAPPAVTFEATSLDNNVVSVGNATASDIEPVTITNNASKAFPLGKTTILWTAVDKQGLKTNATETIDVIHTIPPKITPPKDVTFEATSLDNNTMPLGNATASDIEPVTITNNASKAFPLGKTVVLWTAKDTSGNTANATQVVDVVHTIPPKITPPKDVTFEATSLDNNTMPLGNATASDIEPVTITNNASKAFPLGKTVVLWTAKDTSGNTANATQVVDVVHTIPPKLAAPPAVTFEATSLDNNTVPLGTPAVSDIEQVTVTNNAPKSFPIGMTTVTWTAKDTSGNTANATQVVDVIHTIPPKLAAPPAVTFEATSLDNNVVSVGNATASDIEPVTITNNASKAFPLGKTVVLWTAKDRSGNTANATQVVDVVDTTAPKITPPPAVTVVATSLDNNTVPLGNATATDNVKVVSVTNNASKAFPLGRTTILWTATDESGNRANATQIVDVVNTTPPKLAAPPAVTFEATSLDNNAVPLGNATASDIEPVTITNNASKAFPLGKTVVLWTAKDRSGNTSNATQVVDVVDTIPPKISVPPAIMVNATSPTSNTVPLGNATATDNTKVVSITNNAPPVFPFGNTTVTWTARDVAGNTANATQLVEVVDHTPPQLTIPSSVVINATAFETPVQIGQATATGIIDTSPKISNNSTGTFHIGRNIVQWTAVDKFGNVKTLDQTVNVLACGRPESFYNVIMGTNGSDTLTGSTVPNLILGLDGNDIINAGPAGDCIIAGDGNNVIIGGSGNDMIIAGNGDNIIKGGTGNNLIYVGTGSNMINGGSGQSTCYLGNPSSDTVVNCQSHKQ